MGGDWAAYFSAAGCPAKHQNSGCVSKIRKMGVYRTGLQTEVKKRRHVGLCQCFFAKTCNSGQ